MGQPEPLEQDSQSTKDLFLEALELDDAARDELLARLRATDPERGERLERLFSAHAETGEDWTLEIAEVARGAVPEGKTPTSGLRIGDYELLEEVGAGAMGVVWKARQVSLGRQVAVKLLRSGPFAGEREIERFRAEAEAVARLDHPNIVPVYEVGQLDGPPFFSMRWIEGQDLSAVVDEAWDPREAARLLVVTARAVHHAHQRGLLHRDLKPSNVLIDGESGAPHVVDFGIAKALGSDETFSPTGGVVGTPKYMAPEQTTDGELTVATDVWALGCILYELLSGSAAFDGRTVAEVFFQVCEGEPKRFSATSRRIPRDLETIVLTCLRKQPEARYSSAAALAEDLERWLGHQPIQARRVGTAERLLLYWKRSPLAASLLSITALLVLVVALGGVWANAELRNNLRDSLLGEARATRLSTVAGRRTKALELLRRAAQIRPGPDLRDEAIGTLALADLIFERLLPIPENYRALAFDPAFERYTFGVEGEQDIRVVSVDTGEMLFSLPHDGTHRMAKFSASGSHLVVVSDFDPRISVWDMKTREMLFDIDENVAFDAFDLSPDGSLLALGTDNGDLTLYETVSGRVVFQESKRARVSGISFRPDGERLAVATGVDVDTLETYTLTGEVDDFLEMDEGAFQVRWSPDGSSIAVACNDSNGYVWLPDSGQLYVLRGHAAEVVEVYFCVGSSMVLTHSWDGTVRLWDARAEDEIVSALARDGLEVSTDGRRFAFRDRDGLKLHRLEAGSIVDLLSGGHEGKNPQKVLFDPEDRPVTIGSDWIMFWELVPAPHITRSKTGHVGNGFTIHPDDVHALLGTNTGLEVRRLEDWAKLETLVDGTVVNHGIDALGRTIFVRRKDELHVIYPEDRSRDYTIEVPSHVTNEKISPDGKWIVGGAFAGYGVTIWRTDTGELETVLVPETRRPATAISPDSQWLAVGTRSAYEVVRLGTWEVVHRIEHGRQAAGVIAFSPDSAQLVITLAWGTSGLIDLETGAPIAALTPHAERPISSFAFSKDGSKLAVSYPANFTVVWHLDEMERHLEQLGLSD